VFFCLGLFGLVVVSVWACLVFLGLFLFCCLKVLFAPSPSVLVVSLQVFRLYTAPFCLFCCLCWLLRFLCRFCVNKFFRLKKKISRVHPRHTDVLAYASHLLFYSTFINIKQYITLFTEFIEKSSCIS